jgi:hypothetical protein
MAPMTADSFPGAVYALNEDEKSATNKPTTPDSAAIDMLWSSMALFGE